jgi:hypothetical protein
MRIIFEGMRIIIKQYKNTKKCVYLPKSALYRFLASPQGIFVLPLSRKSLYRFLTSLYTVLWLVFTAIQQVPYHFLASLYRFLASALPIAVILPIVLP